MSEYEIFNGGDNIEIIPEPKKRKQKKTTVKVKDEPKCECKFFKQAFSCENISVSLSVLAIFFAFFVNFIPIMTLNKAGLISAGIFFLLGFTAVFTALIFEIISTVRKKEFIFNGKSILILLAFFLLFI